jgi:enediyne biosynthesis protein E4
MGNDELLSSSGSWPRLQSGDDLSGHQHNPFFVKASNGRYYDLAQDVGLGSTEVSRGIATADVDGDGDLDFAVANQWEPSIFYRNDSPNTGGFLNLHLLRSPQQEQTTVYSSYSKPNRSGSPAIGASAIVHLPNGKQLVAQVDGGNGHSGARSHDLHFGLGNVPQDAQLQVDLHWRDMEGQIHQEVLHLSPGWKTILLGGQSRMQASGDLNTSSVSRES